MSAWGKRTASESNITGSFLGISTILIRYIPKRPRAKKIRAAGAKIVRILRTIVFVIAAFSVKLSVFGLKLRNQWKMVGGNFCSLVVAQFRASLHKLLFQPVAQEHVIDPVVASLALVVPGARIAAAIQRTEIHQSGAEQELDRLG